jgi:ELWxxDGT repeat protein
LQVEQLEERQVLNGEAKLVKDIGLTGMDSSHPGGFTQVGNKIYFAAYKAGVGRELWVTDGTAAGTKVVKDIVSGDQGSSPTQLTAVGDHLYFTTYSQTSFSQQLWISDGTTTGTRRVEGFEPSSSVWISSMTALGGRLYFSLDTNGTDSDLWVSDGTLSGTHLVSEVGPGQSLTITELTTAGNRLFFAAKGPLGHRQLWVSDGSDAGTQAIQAPDWPPVVSMVI